MSFFSLDTIELGAILAGTVGSIGSMVVAVVQRRKIRLEMRWNFRQLMAVRDSVLKAQILAEFPNDEKAEIIHKLDSAFRDAEAQFQNEFLPEIVGREGARRIAQALQERDIT